MRHLGGLGAAANTTFNLREGQSMIFSLHFGETLISSLLFFVCAPSFAALSTTPSAVVGMRNVPIFLPLLSCAGPDGVKAQDQPLCGHCWQPPFAKDLEM